MKAVWACMALLLRRPRQPRRGVLAAAAVCSLLAVAGCGGGGSSSTSHVTRAQLARMVLPRSALGGVPVRDWVKHPVGFQTNAEFARGSLDSRLTAASLAEGGRLSGYVLGYSLSHPQIVRALSRGSGAINVTTEVDLYRDAAGAGRVMARGISDLRSLVGKRIGGGATLAHGATFSVRRVGDAGVGFTFDVIKGVHIYFTEVSFRYGRLLAYVGETRADHKRVDAAVIALARSLDERIKLVLGGKLPTMAASGGTSHRPRPADVALARSIRLKISDFPRGFQADSPDPAQPLRAGPQCRGIPDTADLTLSGESLTPFSSGDGNALLDLSSGAWVFIDAAEAATALQRQTTAALESCLADATIAWMGHGYIPLKYKLVSETRAPLTGLGVQAVAVRLFFENDERGVSPNAAPIAEDLIILRSGRVEAWLATLAGSQKRAQTIETPLLTKLAARMH